MTDLQPFELIRALLLLAGLALVLTAAVIDVRKYLIPNWLNLSLLVVGIVYGLLTPEFKWVLHLACGALMFFGGALLFQFRLLGGGDVKLLAVVSFWAGTGHILNFCFVTAAAGGLLSVIYLSLAWWKKKQAVKADPATDFNILKQPVPYGVAIAAGGVYVFLSIVEHLELVVGM